eukprot:26424_6
MKFLSFCVADVQRRARLLKPFHVFFFTNLDSATRVVRTSKHQTSNEQGANERERLDRPEPLSFSDTRYTAHRLLSN